MKEVDASKSRKSALAQTHMLQPCSCRMCTYIPSSKKTSSQKCMSEPVQMAPAGFKSCCACGSDASHCALWPWLPDTALLQLLQSTGAQSKES